MLIEAKAVKDFRLDCFDGEIGKVKDFYFDDQHWIIRYLVAETGTWLADRQVLISPYALSSISRKGRHITTNLTRKQIEDSPPASTDKPVSRQFEEDYYGYYGWPMYWAGPYPWGPFPKLLAGRPAVSTPVEKPWNPNLRSVHDVGGHHVQAIDGEIGHVDDFIFDDETWAIRYLVIDTRNWWPGNKVLVSPHWIDRVSWSEAKVFASLSRQSIRLSPEYSPASLLTRSYEDSLHLHYQRRGYWEQPAERSHAGRF